MRDDGKRVIGIRNGSLVLEGGTLKGYGTGHIDEDSARAMAFAALQAQGGRLVRCEDGGTPGYWVEGHPRLRFVLDIHQLAKEMGFL